MKFNYYTRNLIINAILADVPKVDYDELIANVAINDRLPRLRPELITMWKDNTLRGYLSVEYDPVAEQHVPFWDVPLSDGATLAITKLREREKKQDETIDELRKKISAMVTPIRTLNQFEKNLPEFIGYLPTDVKKQIANPFPVAVANVVRDLTNLGWPKGPNNASPTVA